MSCSVSNELSYITDTTDAEQDDLPCDGDGGIACKYHGKSDQLNGCTCIVCISDSLNLPCSGDNRNTSANDDIHVQDEGAFDCNTGTIRTVRSSAGIAGSEVSFTQALPAGGSQPDGRDPPSHSNMSHVLLRHFPMGELMSTWQFIERETIPETSLTESIDEATNKHETSERVKGPSTGEQEAARFEEHHLQRLKAANIFQNTEQRCMLKKSVSSHELIEGQGEVQSRQEGHNEVTSEMKVPEMSENKKSIPTVKRTKPFPRLLNQSVTGNNVLENQEEMSIPEPSQQRKILPQSGFPNAGFAIYSGAPEDSTANTCVLLQPAHGLSEPRLPCGTTTSALPATRTVEIRCLNASNLLPETTQGEKMSQILKDQTDQLKTKVEDFSKHMTRETSLLQEDYLVLNQLKTHLDALERNYLTAREEHRNLQLQCYKDKSTGIGEFDPERKVEGEIFRLGTLLEDIQEQADGSKHRWAPSLTSCGSAHSSYRLWESSALSSVTDSPEENAFLPKNNEGENTSQTSSVTLQKNAHFSLQCDRCHLRIHTLQKRAESTYRREMDPLGKSCLLASKCSSSEMRFSPPEGKYEAEGLGFHTQGTLSPKYSASEESMKGKNIQERKTGIQTIFFLRKPTDLSDTNLSSDSEALSAYYSYGSQTEEFVKCGSHKILHTRLHRERKGFKCRCSRESPNQFKFMNYQESVQSCAPRGNNNSGSTSYSQKRIPGQKAQTNQQPPEPIKRLPESKKSARNTTAINTRNRNAKDFNINILNSTLDHAIQTANSLKKATEKMVQAISEDLARAARKQL